MTKKIEKEPVEEVVPEEFVAQVDEPEPAPVEPEPPQDHKPDPTSGPTPVNPAPGTTGQFDPKEAVDAAEAQGTEEAPEGHAD